MTTATRIRRRIVRWLLGAAHAVLQTIVPPGRRHVVFTSIPDHTDSSFAVYRHLLRTRRNLRITWIVVDMDSATRILDEFAALVADLPDGHGHRLGVRSRHGWQGYLAYLRAGVVFHTHGVFAFARTDIRRHIVSLWHGMPIKAIGKLNDLTHGSEYLPYGTTHVATSEMFRYIISESFGVDPRSVLMTTLPRTDALVADGSSGPSAADIRSRLGLDPRHRLIVWMPTYRSQANANFVVEANRKTVDERPRTFLDDIDPGLVEALDRHCGASGCQVVIKLHPLDALNHTRGEDWPYQNIRLLTSEEFLASGLQLYDVLGHCDALMSDLSSVLIDFVITGRPIGLIGLPFDIYERNLLLPLEPFADSPRFDHLQTPADVECFVSDVAAGRHHDADSFVAMLHADHETSGSETVLRHVGL